MVMGIQCRVVKRKGLGLMRYLVNLNVKMSGTLGKYRFCTTLTEGGKSIQLA